MNFYNGIPASDAASSATGSGIAEGAIEIRDGDTTALASLDRSVTGLQNTGLAPVFDERNVEEQLELGRLAGQVGFRAAGDLAAAMGWQEGSAEKVILHGAVGAAVAILGGGDALQGLTGAAANQLAFNAIRDYLTGQNIDPDGPAFALFMQLASLAVGAAAGGESGAGTTLAATQNNWLNHREYEEAMQAKAACDQGNAQSCARYEALAQLDQQRDQDFAQYLRDVSLAAHREGKPLDEAFYRDIQKQYWREQLGWGGEPYYLSDTHRPLYPTTQQEAYRFFTEGPGKYLGPNVWVTTSAAGWAGDFIAAWKDWLNPGSGQNALTGETVEGVDAWGKRFAGAVEIGTLFIGGGMTSPARTAARIEQAIHTKASEVALTEARIANNFYKDGSALAFPQELHTSSGIVIRANPDKTTTVLGTFFDDTNSIINRQLSLPRAMIYDGPSRPGSFNLLNTPNEVYSALGQERFWTEVNKPFIDAAIARGDDIVLATTPSRDTLNRRLLDGTMVRTGFGREYDYLISRGYVYDSATGKMNKP